MEKLTDDLKFWAALASHPQIGAMTFQKIIYAFPSMFDVWTCAPKSLIRPGLNDKIVKIILEARATIDPDKVMVRLKRHDIGLITLAHKNYPHLLRQIPDPPAVLFIRGRLSQADDISLAVVGSRKFSPYGRSVTEELVTGLVENGFVIISGLALGIDGIAHETTLRAKGRTIAVLGSGVDSIYPATHSTLAKSIVESGGALISEFPPATISYPSNFPVRNRIIAGLSLGTLVIEAGLDSGSLLTARSALDYNREVFAVPGDIGRPTSQGANNLIKMGAKLVSGVEDILTELNVRGKKAAQRVRRTMPDTPEEAQILSAIPGEPIHINAIVKESKMNIEKVGAVLVLMEMKGKVKNVGGNTYVKIE